MLKTRAEASEFQQTSLHADVLDFIGALSDKRLHTTTFGQSVAGRVLPLLVLSSEGVTTPAEARALGRPVVLMLDGIHPGEVEGKEASLALVRDLLGGPQGELLEHLTLVVVPLFNPDGNDALDPANRALDLPRLQGQPGPVVGTRTQSEGVNLNRDYMRQQTVEMRALQSRVCQPWAPDLTIDNHATNGSVHRFDMTVDVPHTIDSGNREAIVFARDRLVPWVTDAVRRGHGVESGWYGNFVEDERQLESAGLVDPNTPVNDGWITYPHHPRFGSNYRGLLGRLDLLLECYSYLPFEARVKTAYAWQIETLRFVAGHAEAVNAAVAGASKPPNEVAVRYRLDRAETPITVPTFTPRAPGSTPTAVTVPHWSRFVGTTVVPRPRAYAVPPAVADHLRRHGLVVDAVEDGTTVDAQIATIDAVGTVAGRKILEAAKTGDLTVSWRDERRALPEGVCLVRTDQPNGAVAVYLCEPQSDDGLVENEVIAATPVGSEHPVWRVQ